MNAALYLHYLWACIQVKWWKIIHGFWMQTFYRIHIAVFQIGTYLWNFYLSLILTNFTQKEPKKQRTSYSNVRSCSFWSNQNQRQTKFSRLTPWYFSSDVKPRYLYSFHSKIANHLKLWAAKNWLILGVNKSNLASFFLSFWEHAEMSAESDN